MGIFGNIKTSPQKFWPSFKPMIFQTKPVRSGSRFTGLNSKLSRQLGLWILFGILGIEAMIFLPSAYRRKSEKLGELEMTALATIDTLAITQPDAAQFFQYLPQLQQNAPLIAGQLYRDNGQTAGAFGPADGLSFDQAKQLGKVLHYTTPWRYDIARRVKLQDGNYYLILSYDATAISSDLIAFSRRILGLVVLISISVSGLMIWIINHRLIGPIVRLQSDVREAGIAIAQGTPTPSFLSWHYKISNELQDVIQAFFATHMQTLEAIALRQESEANLRQTKQQLETTITDLKHTQAQLVHTEKMSSLGQLGAGFAHEINNPINFIYANLAYLEQYSTDLLELITQYETVLPNPPESITQKRESMEFEFIQEDMPNVINSMQSGAIRIRDLVASFRNFVRLDEAELKPANIHESLDNTLLLLNQRLETTPYRGPIAIERQYGQVAPVTCYPAQLNQVFFYLLANAIEGIERLAAVETKAFEIVIKTIQEGDQVAISMTDNGMGIEPEILHKVFDPFFTTKDVGSGTGIGLTNSHHIIENIHRGSISLTSMPKTATTLTIVMPLTPAIGAQPK
jgi:signal transduction histidine kinase